MSDCDQHCADIDRCRREIADLEAQILAGHPDLRGLCLALSDWSWELRLLQDANKGEETARLAPVCARFAKGGPVVRSGRGPRNVGPQGRNTGVLRCFRFQCRRHNDRR
jgi:hypothetical protein